VTGTIVEHYGFSYGFMTLSTIGTISFLLLRFAMPETLAP
jgi:hypothetical protein